MSFPRYGSYKDCGVEWLGEVPSHWVAGAFKNWLTNNDGGVWGDDPDGVDDTIVLRSTEQTLDGYWQILDPARRRINKRDKETSRLLTGDLLTTKSSGSSLHIGKTTIVTAEISAMGCCYSNFMQRLRTVPDLDPRLAWYFLNSNLARSQFDYLSNSTTGLANLSATIIGDIAMIVPASVDQSAIIVFLDRETAKIDALIEEQRRLVELLKEKQQAVISHTVTKGIDPHVPMKDSGVAWIGKVPSHWHASALKRTWNVTDCKHLTAEFVDDGVPLASIKEVQGHFIDLSTAKQTTEGYYEQLVEGNRQPQAGDLIFSRNATVGEVAQVADWHPPFAMGQDVCLLRKKECGTSTDFLQHVLRSSIVINQLAIQMIGSTFKRVNVEDIRNIFVPIPPSHEQHLIADFLYSEKRKSDSLVKEATTAIDLLRERRSALISAAVTGKIDVRDHVPAQVAAE